MRVAELIKEEYSYVCPDIVKEFKKYDQEPDKFFKKYNGIHTMTNRVSEQNDVLCDAWYSWQHVGLCC